MYRKIGLCYCLDFVGSVSDINNILDYYKHHNEIVLEIDLADLVSNNTIYVYYGAGSDNWCNDSFIAQCYGEQTKA